MISLLLVDKDQHKYNEQWRHQQNEKRTWYLYLFSWLCCVFVEEFSVDRTDSDSKIVPSQHNKRSLLCMLSTFNSSHWVSSCPPCLHWFVHPSLLEGLPLLHLEYAYLFWWISSMRNKMKDANLQRRRSYSRGRDSSWSGWEKSQGGGDNKMKLHDFCYLGIVWVVDELVYYWIRMIERDCAVTLASMLS